MLGQLAAVTLSLLAPPAAPLTQLGAAARCVVPLSAAHGQPGRSALLLRSSSSSLAASARAPPVRMQEAPFWSNVERFARFFISSVAGLILQLLSPFAMFSRSPALAAVGGTLFIGILAFIYITLTAMQAPLDVAVATEAARDPSMQTMLNDIYGP